MGPGCTSRELLPCRSYKFKASTSNHRLRVLCKIAGFPADIAADTAEIFAPVIYAVLSLAMTGLDMPRLVRFSTTVRMTEVQVLYCSISPNKWPSTLSVLGKLH